jgi:hypothetical protein
MTRCQPRVELVEILNREEREIRVEKTYQWKPPFLEILDFKFKSVGETFEGHVRRSLLRPLLSEPGWIVKHPKICLKQGIGESGCIFLSSGAVEIIQLPYVIAGAFKGCGMTGDC